MRQPVDLRPLTPGDLKTVTRMAVAFNKEDGHPLSAGGRHALKMLCEGTPHGLGYMIEHRGEAVGYLVVGLGFSVEYGGVDGFLDEFGAPGARTWHGRDGATRQTRASPEDQGASS